MKRANFSKVFKVLLLALAFQFVQFSSIFAQCDATLTTRGSSIELQGTDLCEEWTIDIADLGLTSEADANMYFKGNRDNISSFTVNWAEKEATMTIMLDYMPSWTIADWNNYFETHPMKSM